MQTICTSLRADNHTGVTEIMQNEQCPVSVQQVVLSASWRKAGIQRVILWSVGECWLLGWVGERGLWQWCGQDTVITGPTSEAEAASSRLESWSTDMLLLQGTSRVAPSVQYLVPIKNSKIYVMSAFDFQSEVFITNAHWCYCCLAPGNNGLMHCVCTAPVHCVASRKRWGLYM